MGRGYHLSKYDSLECSSANGKHVQNGWDDELKEEDVWGEEDTNGSCDRAYFEQKETHWAHAENGTSSKSSKGRKSYLSMELHATAVSEKDKEYIGVGFAMLENGGTNDGWAPGFLARKVKLSQFSKCGEAGGSRYGNGWYDNHHHHHHQDAVVNGSGVPQSAPVSVPVWPSQQEAGTGFADGAESEDGECNGEEEEDSNENGYHDDDDDDVDGNDNHGQRRRGRLAPHEIVDREYAHSQKTTFSVIEGAGCTLKGMDLRRVRNAVWSRTGFVD